jgi:NADPH-dependent 2,4-dienoyl-CoA reductase/sulfur reductase-like enzyme/rhodanese-related sulfurtransferase
MARKILIVGGSLGGAAVAARIRSLDSQAEIILFEKGASIAQAGFAWPGLLADDNASPRDRMNQTAEDFQRQYRVDVRTNSEVVAIHRLRRLIDVRQASDRQARPYHEKYDCLILATGCAPVRAAAFADACEGVFSLKSLSDVQQIRAWLARASVRQAVIIGGTPSGLQAADALAGRGFAVTVIEKDNHLLKVMDPDMARVVEGYLRQKGVQLTLSRQVIRVARQDGHLFVQMDDQSSLSTDLVIVTGSLKPDTALAVKAGLKTGPFDTLLVNSSGQTSDKRIFAVGALVASVDQISGKPVWLPSVASVIQQSRQAADGLCGRPVTAAMTLGQMHMALPGLDAGSAGAGESDLIAWQAAYNRTYSIVPGDSGQPFLIVKVLWSQQSHRLLGAQLVSGGPAFEKLSLLSLAIQARQTVEDLGRLEMPADDLHPGRRHWLAMAGLLAQNQLDGLVKDFSIYDLASLDTSRAVLVDVRSRDEFLRGSITGAISLPLPDLIAGLQDGRTDLLPARPVYVFSNTGRQGYLAARQLMQAGRSDVFNLAGGYWLYSRVLGRLG